MGLVVFIPYQNKNEHKIKADNEY